MNSNLYILGDTYTFNPKTVLDLRAEWLRFRFSKIAKVNNFLTIWARLGRQTGRRLSSYTEGRSPTIFQDLHSTAASRCITFCPTQTRSPFHQCPIRHLWHYRTGQQWDNYGLNGTLSRVFGKHTVKFGFEARLMDMEVLPAGAIGELPPSAINTAEYRLHAVQIAAMNGPTSWMGYFVTATFGGSYGGTEFNCYQAYLRSGHMAGDPKPDLEPRRSLGAPRVA